MPGVQGCGGGAAHPVASDGCSMTMNDQIATTNTAEVPY